MFIGNIILSVVPEASDAISGGDTKYSLTSGVMISVPEIAVLSVAKTHKRQFKGSKHHI